jgi:hypothetical protein
MSVGVLVKIFGSFYIRLGVKTRIFHLGDYRRATIEEMPEDYFFVNGE